LITIKISSIFQNIALHKTVNRKLLSNQIMKLIFDNVTFWTHGKKSNKWENHKKLVAETIQFNLHHCNLELLLPFDILHKNWPSAAKVLKQWQINSQQKKESMKKWCTAGLHCSIPQDIWVKRKELHFIFLS